MRGKGTTKARLHPSFAGNAGGLQDDARQISESLQGRGQRPWQVLPLDDWSGDPLDVPGIAGKFDREEIGENYAACLSDAADPGTTGDAQALKLQSDWVAVQERAFRTRHATSVRCALNAAGRRRGHASDAGPIRTGVVKYVEDVIKRGAS